MNGSAIRCDDLLVDGCAPPEPVLNHGRESSVSDLSRDLRAVQNPVPALLKPLAQGLPCRLVSTGQPAFEPEPIQLLTDGIWDQTPDFGGAHAGLPVRHQDSLPLRPGVQVTITGCVPGLTTPAQ